MRIPSFSSFGAKFPLGQSLSSAPLAEDLKTINQLKDLQKSVIKETLLNTPRTDQLIGTNAERYYRELDLQNRDYLSKRDPDALLYYSLVKNTSPKDTKLDLIESTNGTKDIGLISEIKPDPRIEKIVSEYKKAQGK